MVFCRFPIPGNVLLLGTTADRCIRFWKTTHYIPNYPSPQPRTLLPLPRSSLPRPIPIHPILHPQPRITARLENATHLKRPRHLARIRGKKKAHLHRVSEQPIREHRDAKALAGSGALVGEDLRERKDGFDGEAEVADEVGVEGVRGGLEEDVDDEEGEGEEEEEFPVAVGRVGGVSFPPCFSH